MSCLVILKHLTVWKATCWCITYTLIYMCSIILASLNAKTKLANKIPDLKNMPSIWAVTMATAGLTDLKDTYQMKGQRMMIGYHIKLGVIFPNRSLIFKALFIGVQTVWPQNPIGCISVLPLAISIEVFPLKDGWFNAGLSMCKSSTILRVLCLLKGTWPLASLSLAMSALTDYIFQSI